MRKRYFDGSRVGVAEISRRGVSWFFYGWSHETYGTSAIRLETIPSWSLRTALVWLRSMIGGVL